MRNLQRVAAGIDALLAPHESLLADQYITYRNHACRVAAFHCMLDGSADDVREHVLVAAAFHDLGIWTANTFDYIEPSVLHATGYLQSRPCGADGKIVTAMIRNHHKLTQCASGPPGATELFRQADWVDVSGGLVRFGLPRASIAAVRAVFPTQGFHGFLCWLAVKRLLTHPWSPLPMLRW